MAFQYSGNIFGQAKVGQVFVISGTTLPSAERVEIWLQNGKLDGVSVPLHFAVRFRENMIVRNSKIGQKWGPEEREENLDQKTPRMPLKAGEHFKVYIFVGNDRFLISVNDKTYCSYKYRLPISEIKTIAVNKDLATLTQVDQRSVFPMPCPTVLLDNPKLDFSNDVPRKFRAGHQITITGIPLGNIHGHFAIRMFEGKKQALHFNPRFVPYNFVAINSQNDDMTWQNEERPAAFPFAINTKFELSIVLTESEFRFTVNNKQLGSYSYRSKQLLGRLNGLKIQGKDGVRVQILSVDHVAT